MSIFTHKKYENFPVWAIYGIVCFLFLDCRSFFVWSIAHIVFLVVEEILDQREVRDRVGLCDRRWAIAICDKLSTPI
ncbi:MAG: hypothetical protein ACM65L_05995 [Microcoleus sp.]